MSDGWTGVESTEAGSHLALIDSGAAMDCISQGYIDQHNLSDKVRPAEPMSFRTGNGMAVSTGVLQVKVCIPSATTISKPLHFPVSFRVLPTDIAVPPLLSNPTLRAWEGELEFSTDTLRLQGTRVKTVCTPSGLVGIPLTFLPVKSRKPKKPEKSKPKMNRELIGYVADKEGKLVPRFGLFLADSTDSLQKSGNGVSPSEPRGTSNTEEWTKVTKGGRHRR
jgi:hypothetical protein